MAPWFVRLAWSRLRSWGLALLVPVLTKRSVLQVHDELVFECPKGDAAEIMNKIKAEMENTVNLKIPLIAEAEIGDNWNEAH